MSDSDASNGPIRADIPPDSTSDTRWLSYRELADILAPVKLESVIRLVRRKKWVKRESNSGVRVAVPADVLADMLAKRRDGSPSVRQDIRADKPADIRPDIREDMSRTINALEAAVSTMAEQMAALRVDQERERRDWAEQLSTVRAELDKARAAVSDQRSRADRAEGMVQGMKTAASAPSGFSEWWRSVRAAFRP